MLAMKGLGYLWPYLAGYPMDKVAVINNACQREPVALLQGRVGGTRGPVCQAV